MVYDLVNHMVDHVVHEWSTILLDFVVDYIVDRVVHHVFTTWSNFINSCDSPNRGRRGSPQDGPLTAVRIGQLLANSFENEREAGSVTGQGSLSFVALIILIFSIGRVEPTEFILTQDNCCWYQVFLLVKLLFFHYYFVVAVEGRKKNTERIRI